MWKFFLLVGGLQIIFAASKTLVAKLVLAFALLLGLVIYLSYQIRIEGSRFIFPYLGSFRVQQ